MRKGEAELAPSVTGARIWYLGKSGGTNSVAGARKNEPESQNGAHSEMQCPVLLMQPL